MKWFESWMEKIRKTRRRRLQNNYDDDVGFVFQFTVHSKVNGEESPKVRVAETRTARPTRALQPILGVIQHQ